MNRTKSSSVTPIIAVKEPNRTWLAETLGSFDRQTVRPKEVIIVENSQTPTVGAFDVSFPIRYYHRPDLPGMGAQWRHAVSRADTEAVMKADEDNVLVREDHIERALSKLAEDDIVAVGGRPAPIRGNVTGRLISKAVRAVGPRAWRPVFYTNLCPEGERCFSTPNVGAGFSLREHFKQHGTVYHDDELVVLTDLPTGKQKLDPDAWEEWWLEVHQRDGPAHRRAATLFSPERPPTRTERAFACFR